MPYISTQEVASIRQAIKANFPNTKFSITRDNRSGLRIAVLAHPVNLLSENNQLCGSESINHYLIKELAQENECKALFFQQLVDTINSVKARRTMFEDADYGSVPNYYLSLTVGAWNKRFEVIPFKISKKKAA